MQNWEHNVKRLFSQLTQESTPFEFHEDSQLLSSGNKQWTATILNSDVVANFAIDPNPPVAEQNQNLIDSGDVILGNEFLKASLDDTTNIYRTRTMFSLHIWKLNKRLKNDIFFYPINTGLSADLCNVSREEPHEQPNDKEEQGTPLRSPPRTNSPPHRMDRSPHRPPSSSSPPPLRPSTRSSDVDEPLHKVPRRSSRENLGKPPKLWVPSGIKPLGKKTRSSSPSSSPQYRTSMLLRAKLNRRNMEK